MVSNEQKSWLDTLETRISPPMTVAERVAAPASPQAWQDILEHFFRQSYLLTAMPFFQLLVQRLAHAFQVRGVYLALFPEGSNVQTLAFWLDTKLVGTVAYDLTTAPCVDVVQEGDLQYVEAVTAVSQFAFETLGAKRVEIRCDANNVRSAAIPPKVGFVHEATLRQDGRHHVSGDLRDTMIFAKIA